MHDFSFVLNALKTGKGIRIARKGWNGKNMFLFLVAGSKFKVSRAPLNEFYKEGTEVSYRPHLDMKYVDGSIGVWSPSNLDLLEEDWMFV